LFVSARLLANGLTVVIHLLKWIGNDSYITYINYGPSNRFEIDVTGPTNVITIEPRTARSSIMDLLAL